jgi:sigma-E factor negative regulatory protein RseC
MRNEATVVAVNGNRATVEARRLSACEGCHKKVEGEGCSVCTLMGGDGAIRTEAENPLGAVVGDRVIIESGTGRMLWYAALVFLLPIVLALTAYGIAARFTDAAAWQLGAAAIAFVGTFWGLFAYSKAVQKKRCDATIVEIVERG